MDLFVTADGTALWKNRRFDCALGAEGLSRDKHEGDMATPVGKFPLRRVLYRPDRVAAPTTVLPVAALTPLDGWCDDPGDSRYNQLVCQPYPASLELLWRDDGIYDVIVVLGYNDTPAVPGRGSAIFLHLAQPDFSPTQGCVALSPPDLATFLGECALDTKIDVTFDPAP